MATVKILQRVSQICEQKSLSSNTQIRLLYPIATQGNIIDTIEENIIRHNTEPKSTKIKTDGAKNFIFQSIYSIVNDLRNYPAAYTAVSMDAPQEAASKSVEGERVKRLTNFCPTTKYSMFVANMCGKDDIGISAVGQKVFLACTQYFNNELKRIIDTRGIITKEDIERSPIYVKKAFEFYRRRLNNKNESITKSVLVISETLANITTNNSILDQRIKDIFNEIAAVGGAKIINEFDVGNNLKEGEGDYDAYDYVDNLTERKFEDDQSIVISALISASTD